MNEMPIRVDQKHVDFSGQLRKGIGSGASKNKKTDMDVHAFINC